MICALVSAMSGVCTRKRAPPTPLAVASVASCSNAAMNSGRQSGIAGIVERVDADDDVARVEHFGPAERERQEHRVARRHVGRGNLRGIDRPILRHRQIARQRRAAERGQVHGDLDVAGDAERPRDRARRLDLARVPLAVRDGERVQAEPFGPRDGRGRVGIQPAAQQNDRVRHRAWTGSQMYLCSCTCTRTGSRSASTHSDSVRRSISPCTGEKWIAAARAGEIAIADDVARVLVVGAVLDDELHLVVRPQAIEVRPVHPVRFAAAGTLHVENRDHLGPARARCCDGRRFRAARSCRAPAARPSADTRPPAAAARRRSPRRAGSRSARRRCSTASSGRFEPS